MSVELPWEPSPNAPITADWGKAVVRALRALQPKAGPGVLITGPNPNGTTYSAALAAAGMKAQMGHGVLKMNVLVAELVDGQLEMKCRELYVLGRGELVEFTLPQDPPATVDQDVVESIDYNEATKTLSQTKRTIKVIEAGEPTTDPVFVATTCDDGSPEEPAP